MTPPMDRLTGAQALTLLPRARLHGPARVGHPTESDPVAPQTGPLIRPALLVRIYMIKSRNGEFVPEDESRLAYCG
jgi:hypothetical protein